jgi:TatD DNase family protein
LTFLNSKENKSVVKNMDIENLLLETDAPYLTPHPYRGKRNEPRNVTFVVDEIARIKNLPYEEVANKTYKNALEVFNLCEE